MRTFLTNCTMCLLVYLVCCQPRFSKFFKIEFDPELVQFLISLISMYAIFPLPLSKYNCWLIGFIFRLDSYTFLKVSRSIRSRPAYSIKFGSGIGYPIIRYPNSHPYAQIYILLIYSFAFCLICSTLHCLSFTQHIIQTTIALYIL